MTTVSLASPADTRKRLGQVFTGEPLSRLLAALADAGRARTVIDPMSGLGDMLTAAVHVGAKTAALAAIEIDPEVATFCAGRLLELGVRSQVVNGNAFDPASWAALSGPWELVITNPPYVRYQLGSAALGGSLAIPSADEVRNGLIACLATDTNLTDDERAVFISCAEGYSGLSDLAVPAWLLCCSRVSLGGKLAIVAPDTWLSRDYATPVLYVLRRFFEIEFVIEDTDRSWFSDALVRTTLVVARRVADRSSPFAPGGHLRLTMPSDLGDDSGLVGRAFQESATPEREFAAWARSCLAKQSSGSLLNARATWSDEHDLIAAIRRGIGKSTTLPTHHLPPAELEAPERLRNLLPKKIAGLTQLSDLGWAVGQGLRTGANDFFYVTEDPVRRALYSSLLPGEALRLPDDVLRPAVRRQSELPQAGRQLRGRPGSLLLVLSDWALPEDIEAADGPKPWRPMEGDLARLVRAGAGSEVVRPSGRLVIPELSAVRTNVQAGRQHPARPASFWYHMPPLAPRHQPTVLIARVNGGRPAAYFNPGRLWVIDANFSTLWPIASDAVDPMSMLALLSSSWVDAFLEVSGTVMGGGALKIEATHLRRLLLPTLDRETQRRLGDLGGQLMVESRREAVITEIDQTVLAALGAGPTLEPIKDLAGRQRLERSRRRNRVNRRQSALEAPSRE